jgi:hypothetical protein
MQNKERIKYKVELEGHQSKFINEDLNRGTNYYKSSYCSLILWW